MLNNWVNFQSSKMKKLWDLAHEIGGLCIKENLQKWHFAHYYETWLQNVLQTYLLGTLIFFNEEDAQKFLDKLGGGSH